MTEYSNILKNLWQGMDHYQGIQMKCGKEATMLKRFVKKERIFEFLGGLNLEFNQVRVQILGKEDLSSLNKTISMIRVEEASRGVTMNETPAIESSSLLSTTRNMKNSGVEHQPGANN